MNIYRIKRKSDGKFYRNRSRFTKYGNYFILEQLEQNLQWILKKYDSDELEILTYRVIEWCGLEFTTDQDRDDIIKILSRDNIIEEILNEDEGRGKLL
jgi:hypothetical protein